MRKNGGGSLEEALSLTGLFLKSGPIVQTKDYSGAIRISSDPDSGIAYSGPMVVLTSRQSASASEIFAAALRIWPRGHRRRQEHIRQRHCANDSSYWPVRFAAGQSYRRRRRVEANHPKILSRGGRLTQLHGVASDIVLPSLSDLPEFGEVALKNALGYDEVTKAKFTKWSDNHSLFIDQLRRRSEERVKGDAEFHYVMEDMNRLRHKIDENRISLNEDARKKEVADDKLRKETRSKERLARVRKNPASIA